MGELARISGPLIVGKGMKGSTINEVVKVGKEKLLGEIIALHGDEASIQVYEDTSGLKPGDPIEATGAPLQVELGPGLLTTVFDGIQRPLEAIRKNTGDFITRGVYVPSLDRKKKWAFKPTAKKGAKVSPGDVLGTVKEGDLEHKILVPPKIGGTLDGIHEGSFTVEEEIAKVGGKKISLMQKWPVRAARPYKEKKRFEVPLVSGKRILDTFFPIAKGGAAAIPGGFGTGKCVSGSTPVMLADGSLLSMRELYEYFKTHGMVTANGFEEVIRLKDEQAITVKSLHGNKLCNARTTVFYKGYSDSLLRIKTRSGRVAEVTPVHKLFVFSKDDCQVRETPANSLKNGDHIIAIRKTSVNSGNAVFDVYSLENARVADEEIRNEIARLVREKIKLVGQKLTAESLGLPQSIVKRLAYSENLPILKHVKKVYAHFGLPLPFPKRLRGDRRGVLVTIPKVMSAELAEFLGFYLSEGYTRRNETIVFTNNDEKLLNRFSELAHNLFGVNVKIEKWGKKATNALISSRVLVDFINKVGVNGLASRKRLPNFILSSDDACIAAFLKAYFLGDGSFSGGELEITTASEKMQTNLSFLLTRLGIMHSLKKRFVSGKPHYRVFVRGKDNLQELLEKLDNANNLAYEKVERIRSYVRSKTQAYTCVDVVPVSSETLKQAYVLAGSPRSFLEANGVFVNNYIRPNSETMSVKTFKKFVSLLTASPNTSNEGDREQVQIQLSRLQAISELLDCAYFDEITSIERVSGPHEIFDVSIPETENWVGGFGALLLHNTVTQQDLAKYADADVIVYIGCGERGNEMTEVLTQFPELVDPKTKKPLMNRTVLIANTSNMPVAAREASIYTGVTIAEYYRDMGFDVALMADSTSRWAEAMREISGRMEEMPGEEGYPAYLSRKLAEFYERSGRVECLGSPARVGSVSIIGAVSPPGGDISEPVSQGTLRITKAFWALDSSLARRRHYPAINWLKSYSLYLDELGDYYAKHVAPDFMPLRAKAMELLQKEAELQAIVQLVGPDALPERERLVLEATKMIREDFLQQHSFEEIDAYSSPQKQYWLLKAIMHYYEKAQAALVMEMPLEKILGIKERQEIAQLKRIRDEGFEKKVSDLMKSIDSSLSAKHA